MRHRRHQYGVALVEFALVLPVLLILTFVTTEYGRAMYEYNTLTKSVRDAVRYLSTRSPWVAADAGLPANVTTIATAKNLVVYGNPAGTGSPLVIGLTTALVPNPVWATAGTAPLINTVRIRINGYTFRPLFASAFGVNFGNITFPVISATMRGAL